MTNEQKLARAAAMIDKADGYADDERVYFAGEYWSAWNLRDTADWLIEQAEETEA